MWFDAILHWFAVGALNCAESLELLITMLRPKLSSSYASESAIHEKNVSAWIARRGLYEQNIIDTLFREDM